MRPLFAVVLCLGFSPVLWAQSLQNQSQSKDQDQTQTQDNKTAPSAAQASADATQPSAQKPEVKITPHEAEELFHSVDEILAFDSKHTGLPIKKEVKRRLTSRDEVVAYLTKHMKDEDVKRMQRSELVLKKFRKVAGCAAARAGRGILRSEDENRKSAGLGSHGRTGASDGA